MWLEGISVWPSLVLRFVGLVTMLGLVLAFTISIRRQAHLISERFELPMPRTWKLARSRWSAVRTGPHLDLASFGPEGKADRNPRVRRSKSQACGRTTCAPPPGARCRAGS